VEEFQNVNVSRLAGGGGFGVGGRRIFVEFAGGHAFVGGEGFVFALGFGGSEFLFDVMEGVGDRGGTLLGGRIEEGFLTPRTALRVTELGPD
jgi:hypothetical protein